MREVSVEKIKKTISELCIEANISLRKDVLSMLKNAARIESNRKAKRILDIIVENAKIAKEDDLALCQDTGMACVYLEIGQGVKIIGAGLERAVNEGVRLGYKKGYFRNSVVDPITGKNTGDNTPAVIHTKIVKGNSIKIMVVPKGFGCENKNQLKMFKPTVGLDEIKEFIVDVVRMAGPDACPPYIIGVGIGGTFEKAAELSKEALLRKIKNQKSKIKITCPPCPPSVDEAGEQNLKILGLERELLKEVNRLNIGPAGVGGKTTALAVNILTYPTHIAGLPVAVSIGCHAMRSATKIV